MVNYEQKLREAQELIDRSKAVVNNPEAPAEEQAKVREWMETAKKLQAEAAQLKDIVSAAQKNEIMRKHNLEHIEKPTDEEPKEWKDWGDFLGHVHAASRRTAPIFDPRLKVFKDMGESGDMRTKAMAENVGASGGFLVPTEWLSRLYSVSGEDAIVRPRASVIRMRRRQIQIPVLDQTDTTAGIPHWFGGMKFYWTEEGASKTNTDPEFRQINLVAHKLIGYTYASDELVDDAAISLGDFLAGPLGFVGGALWMEDYSFIAGTGAGQPLGIINAGATITVARTATNPAIQYGDLVNMLEAFLPNGRGVWVITQSAMSTLLTMNGPTGNPSYLWGNAADGAPGTLLGHPVIWSEKASAEGSAGDVILADWRYYLIGDRQAATVESTQFDRWNYDQTSWRMVHRVDGQPWLSAPLTLQDGATQVSPFVILGAKST